MKAPQRIYRGRRGPGRVPVVIADGIVLIPDAASLVTFFDWGSATPGSTALARALLTEHLGAMPARSVLHRFAFLTVSRWMDDQWTKTTEDIDLALAHVRQDLSLSCLLCGDTGRREVQQRLWRLCECQAPTIPAPAA
jgi:hypothetical protein